VAEQHFRKPKAPAVAPSGGAATFQRTAEPTAAPAKPSLKSMSLVKTTTLIPVTTLAAV